MEKVTLFFCPICQDSEHSHARVTGQQVDERHRPGWEQGLAPLFQANDDGQEQADSQSEANWNPVWEQTRGAFIQKKTQDTEQDKMSHFISPGKIV